MYYLLEHPDFYNPIFVTIALVLGIAFSIAFLVYACYGLKSKDYAATIMSIPFAFILLFEVSYVYNEYNTGDFQGNLRVHVTTTPPDSQKYIRVNKDLNIYVPRELASKMTDEKVADICGPVKKSDSVPSRQDGK